MSLCDILALFAGLKKIHGCFVVKYSGWNVVLYLVKVRYLIMKLAVELGRFRFEFFFCKCFLREVRNDTGWGV